MPDDDIHKDDFETDESSERQLTESMKRIAGYIAEFQAKYRQLEEEQRKRRERKGACAHGRETGEAK
jgi:hypothetical protein